MAILLSHVSALLRALGRSRVKIRKNRLGILTGEEQFSVVDNYKAQAERRNPGRELPPSSLTQVILSSTKNVGGESMHSEECRGEWQAIRPVDVAFEEAHFLAAEGDRVWQINKKAKADAAAGSRIEEPSRAHARREHDP